MDSVSHPTNVVMETGSVLMAVMNSIAVSIVLFACLHYLSCTVGRMLPQWMLVETMSHLSNTNVLWVLQHVPALSGGVTMDSVFHHPGAVMEVQTALMAVMNSTAVSTGLLACMITFCLSSITYAGMFLQ